MRKKNLEALRFLYLCGTCYKTDFYLLLDKTGSHSYMYFDRLQAEIRKWTQADGIVEREIPADTNRQASQTATIVALSEEGIRYYKQNEIPELKKIKSKNLNKFKSVQIEKVLYPHLTEQKVAIMYHLAGVPVFPFEKPSLGYLIYNIAYDKYVFSTRNPYDSNYIDSEYEIYGENEKKEELIKFIKKGAYYTKKEVMDFFKLVTPNYGDNIKTIMWRGMFLSYYQIFINFVLSYGENIRIMLFRDEAENLTNKIKKTIVRWLSVERYIDKISGRPETLNGIEAVTIGSGDSHTYAEATGNKRGLIKKVDTSELQRSNKKFEYVDVTSRIFKHIYSINDRASGIEMLRYITSHSLESYHKEEVELFRSDKRFSLIDGVGENVYPAYFEPLRSRAIMMPVYEIMTLNRLAYINKKDGDPFVIVTKREMMDTISHCLRIQTNSKVKIKNHNVAPGLFFIELLEEDGKYYLGNSIIDERSGKFNVYDENGFIMGKKMIDDYLAEQGIKIKSEAEYLKLAKLVIKNTEGYSDFQLKARFYTAVARSSAELWIDDLKDKMGEGASFAVQIAPIEIKQEKRKYIRHNNERLYLYLTPELKEKTKHIAYLKTLKENKNNNPFYKTNTGSSALIREILVTVLKDVDRVVEQEGINESQALDVVLAKLKTK